MNRELYKMAKIAKGILADIKEKLGITNGDNFITALLGIELSDDEYIPDEELQKVLEEEGIYSEIDLLNLIAQDVWNDYDD